MPYIFECDIFVVQDLRSAVSKYKSSGFPYNWTGSGIKHLMGPRRIDRFVVHQTDGGLTPGERGPLTTAAFLTANPKFKCPACGTSWEGTPRYPKTTCPKCSTKGRDLCTGRGFPKMSYHVFVPWAPLKNEAGKYIIYLCVDFQETTWHTTGANATGIGVAFQGKFISRRMTNTFVPWPETDGQPSPAQQSIWKPLATAWLRDTLQVGNKGVDGHFRHGKPTCPGDWLEDRVALLRQEPSQEPTTSPTDTQFATWEARQQALVDLGYSLGSFGPNHDGVDGKPGNSTRLAIEAFQTDAGIEVTGQWNAETEKAVLVAQSKVDD